MQRTFPFVMDHLQALINGGQCLSDRSVIYDFVCVVVTGDVYDLNMTRVADSVKRLKYTAK